MHAYTHKCWHTPTVSQHNIFYLEKRLQIFLVLRTRFEPRVFWSWVRCSTNWATTPLLVEFWCHWYNVRDPINCAWIYVSLWVSAGIANFVKHCLNSSVKWPVGFGEPAVIGWSTWTHGWPPWTRLTEYIIIIIIWCNLQFLCSELAVFSHVFMYRKIPQKNLFPWNHDRALFKESVMHNNSQFINLRLYEILQRAWARVLDIVY